MQSNKINKNKLGIFVFRRDLRLIDNLGLNLLIDQVDHVIPIFILDKNQIKINTKNKYYFSNNAVQFICESLEDLNQQLSKCNSKLYLFYGEPENIIEKLIKKMPVTHIGFNLDFSVYAINRDNKLIELCKKNNIIPITSDHDQFLLQTDLLLNKKNPFKQFGSFYKNAKKSHIPLPEKLKKKIF
jgi:deoxyribodipyrimidine photo-lyase